MNDNDTSDAERRAESMAWFEYDKQFDEKKIDTVELDNIENGGDE